jgi:hypothetical protein
MRIEYAHITGRRCAWAVCRGNGSWATKLSAERSNMSYRFQLMPPPWSPSKDRVAGTPPDRIRGIVECPLVVQIRRRKVARKTNSPRVGSLQRCGRFTSCYGMNPQRASHRKKTQTLSLIMFERTLGNQRLHHLITHDTQVLSAHEVNVFDSHPDASGIDSLEIGVRMIHDESWKNFQKARSSWSASLWEYEHTAGSEDTRISISISKPFANGHTKLSSGEGRTTLHGASTGESNSIQL